MNKLLASLMIGACALFASAPAQAAYPEKPVNIIIGFAAGGTVDISVRMLAPYIEKELGQPVVITNKGGGAGVPGLNAALAAKPDGYTIASPATPSFSASIFLKNKALNLDEMEFCGSYMLSDRILLTKADKPYKTWQEFTAYVKANPGKVSVGSGGSQEAMEVLRAAAIKDGLDINFVMYKSGGEASSDLMGGHIDACEMGVGTAGYQAARKGELNILANVGAGEITDFPKVPKLGSDLGYGFNAAAAYAFILPKGTPEDIRAYWENLLKKILQNPDLQATMRKTGFAPKFMTGAETKAFCVDHEKKTYELLDYTKKAPKK